MKNTPGLEIYDGYDLLATVPKPIEYLVDRVIPLGCTGDWFSPPGVGKSTLVMSLLLAIACKLETWFGRKLAHGRVAILGGEKSSRDVWVRDIHRVSAGENIAHGDLTCLHNQDPLWTWSRGEGRWTTTDYYALAVDYLREYSPVLTVIDTTKRAAEGANELDNEQQARLARAVEAFRAEIGGTVLTISHTSQCSGSLDLHGRLGYTSRAGGNGYPGILRWLAGMTRITTDQDLKDLGLDGLNLDLRRQQIVAFGVSKNNEMPTAHWSQWHPAIFEIMPEGGVMLLKEGDEDAPTSDMQAQQQAVPAAPAKRRGRPRQGGRGEL